MTDSPNSLAEAHRLIEAGELSTVLGVLGELADEVYEAAMLAGIAANRLGDLTAAAARFQRAMEIDPEKPEAVLNLGLTFRAMEDNAQAESAFRRAIELSPESVPANFVLGNLLLQKGAYTEATELFERVAKVSPHHVGALNNLGICYSRLGRMDESAKQFEAIIAADPENTGALANLGAIRSEQGRSDEAIDLLNRALDLVPGQVEASNNLGVALMDKGRYGKAAALLQPLANGDGAGAETFSNLGNALAKLGDTAGAAAAYEEALGRKSDAGIRVKRAMLLPIVCASRQAMESARSDFARRIDTLISDPPVLADAFAEVGVPTFALSYQDCCNREIMERVGAMYRAACPSLSYTAPHCTELHSNSDGRLRIGFVSRFFQSNSVGRCFHGIPRFHGRDDVEIIVFTFTDEPDPLWGQIEADVDKAIVLPAHMETAVAGIAAERLDILVFTDIGMDPLTYYLAFARLAPLQCALGGHPDAVGLDTIDAYLSCDMQEPEDADEHYLAPLVRLPGAPTYYERPDLPDPLKPRSAFGLPDEVAVYFCGQTLIKVHPDMDCLFDGILSGDPTGLLVFPEGYTPELANLLEGRFHRTLKDHLARVKFLPAMSHLDYMNVTALADVALDTRPFGGGNTSWQAIASGTPMVTWPGRYLRGRYTQALYRLIGVEDAIADSAEEYISRAIRFGTDRAYANAFNARVQDRCDTIFEDRQHVDSLYSYLVDRFRSAH